MKRSHLQLAGAALHPISTIKSSKYSPSRKITCILPSLGVVAISQAPFPEPNPGSPLTVIVAVSRWRLTAISFSDKMERLRLQLASAALHPISTIKSSKYSPSYKITCILSSLGVVAISQPPFPEPNPGSPLTVIVAVSHWRLAAISFANGCELDTFVPSCATKVQKMADSNIIGQ